MNVQMGSDRMAASDDPIFLGLRGPLGREFRLRHAKGKSWRRDAKEVYVLAGAGNPETNVAHPELNDPGVSGLDPAGISGAYLRKGLEPIPNVRGHGEMDDRVQVASIEVELHPAGGGEPLRFGRDGGFWLGLICGLFMDLPPKGDG